MDNHQATVGTALYLTPAIRSKDEKGMTNWLHFIGYHITHREDLKPETLYGHNTSNVNDRTSLKDRNIDSPYFCSQFYYECARFLFNNYGGKVRQSEHQKERWEWILNQFNDTEDGPPIIWDILEYDPEADDIPSKNTLKTLAALPENNEAPLEDIAHLMNTSSEQPTHSIRDEFVDLMQRGKKDFYLSKTKIGQLFMAAFVKAYDDNRADIVERLNKKGQIMTWMHASDAARDFSQRCQLFLASPGNKDVFEWLKQQAQSASNPENSIDEWAQCPSSYYPKVAIRSKVNSLFELGKSKYKLTESAIDRLLMTAFTHLLAHHYNQITHPDKTSIRFCRLAFNNFWRTLKPEQHNQLTEFIKVLNIHGSRLTTISTCIEILQNTLKDSPLGDAIRIHLIDTHKRYTCLEECHVVRAFVASIHSTLTLKSRQREEALARIDEARKQAEASSNYWFKISLSLMGVIVGLGFYYCLRE